MTTNNRLKKAWIAYLESKGIALHDPVEEEIARDAFEAGWKDKDRDNTKQLVEATERVMKAMGGQDEGPDQGSKSCE